MVGCEDVNYAKLAIRFTANLTKDNVFSALRDLVQRLGAAISEGKDVRVDFRVGRLVARGKNVSSEEIHYLMLTYLYRILTYCFFFLILGRFSVRSRIPEDDADGRRCFQREAVDANDALRPHKRNGQRALLRLAI